jgi:hypothetical protein
MSMSSRIALGSLSLLIASVTAQTAMAQQAWVGERDSLSASLDYAYSRSNAVVEDYEPDLDETDPIFNHTASIAVEYTPIEKLGLIATLPLVSSRVGAPRTEGVPPALPHGRYDDGNYHTTLQDFRLDARYMVVDDVVTFSPHVSVSIPVADYETVGFANAGRGLKMLIFGGAIGKYFTSGVPNLYLHGRYEFRWTERYKSGFEQTEKYGQNKSFMDALVGYYILDNLEVNLAGSMQLAHGGFRFHDWLPPSDPGYTAQYPEHFFHDALLAEQFLHVGGGVSYSPMEWLRVSAFVRFFMWGENTRNSDLYGLGLSWESM